MEMMPEDTLEALVKQFLKEKEEAEAAKKNKTNLAKWSINSKFKNKR